VELRDYLRVLRQRWPMIVLCALLALAAGGLSILRTTPVYEATARLFVTSPQSDSSGTAAYQGSLFTQQRVLSYADLVATHSVLAEVIESEGLDLEPADLAERVRASVVPETVLLDVTVADNSPAQAQRLASAVARQFTETVAELERPPGRGEPVVKVSVVQQPTLSETPVSPRPARTLALALVLGLLVGTGIAVLREVLDTSVDSTDEVRDATGAPGLGVIAYDKDASAKPLVVQLEPRSRRAEAFRQIRTNLQFIDVDRPTKVITITSSLPMEGKTTTACNLALTLAEAGQRVVLVEGDLRRPKVAEYLGLVREVGLTNIFLKNLQVSDALQTYADNLTVLASGPIPPNAAELVQSHHMHEVLKALEENADVVLIDAPPLLPVTDGALLAAQSDGAVIVVRHGETKHEQLVHAVEALKSVDARILGTVLNMAPARGPAAYSYGYGYSYEPKARGGRALGRFRKAAARS
jgi:capsular exopolysaccharide synthesis family protein